MGEIENKFEMSRLVVQIISENKPNMKTTKYDLEHIDLAKRNIK